MRMGNVLGKSRVNVFLSKRGRDMIQRLVEELGLSQTGVLELSVRSFYKTVLGDADPSKPKGPTNLLQEHGLQTERDWSRGK